ncbi:hypothetical protein SESBI_34959 [Sesbania bispinosa]|nr:hypothetical protein SESBI_34959 [Sesbania bispinosa]
MATKNRDSNISTLLKRSESKDDLIDHQNQGMSLLETKNQDSSIPTLLEKVKAQMT